MEGIPSVKWTDDQIIAYAANKARHLPKYIVELCDQLDPHGADMAEVSFTGFLISEATVRRYKKESK